MSSHCGANVLACSGAADDVLPLAKGVVVKVKGKLFTVNQGTALGKLQLLVGEHCPGAYIPIDAVGVLGKGFVCLDQGLLDQRLNGHVDVNGGFHGVLSVMLLSLAVVLVIGVNCSTRPCKQRKQ